MRISNRIYGLLALLIMGSASIQGQTTDPFPDVPYRQYFGNMQLSAKAVLNEQVLTEDVVIAIYCGDQIRGKGSPDNPDYPGVAYLTVYGDMSEEQLHCKVAVKGKVIEVDQGDLSYAYNKVMCSPSDPYVINLPVPVVTKPSSEGWATTCLPYNAAVPEGVTVWNVVGMDNGQLKMKQAKGSILGANTPVLLQSKGIDSYEWLSRVADGDVDTPGNIFEGTTEPLKVDANSVMTLGHSLEDGKIGFWLYTGTTIPANRAYIADFPAGASGFAIFDDEATSVNAIASASQQSRQVFDVLGRKVNGKGTMWKKNEKGQIIIIR